MREAEELVKISKYAGERFDLVQSGGGNSSVKLDNGLMLIKASGFSLSEVELDRGYAIVDNARVLEILEKEEILQNPDKRQKDNLASRLVRETVINSANRPSIETFLHSVLYKYTLHTHPIVVNAVTCRSDAQEVIGSLFGDFAWVSYHTPGIELALALKEEADSYCQLYSCKPKIIFLENHGLIVSSNDLEEVIKLTEEVISLLASDKFLPQALEKYKLTSKISSLVNSVEAGFKVAYLSNDIDLVKAIKKKRDLFLTPPFCPDGFVYCGYRTVEIKDLDDKEAVSGYLQKYFELPRIIIWRDFLFFVAQSVKKAREIEDVFKFHVLSLCTADKKISYLSEEELCYLGNWEAEKYRQKL